MELCKSLGYEYLSMNVPAEMCSYFEDDFCGDDVWALKQLLHRLVFCSNSKTR